MQDHCGSFAQDVCVGISVSGAAIWGTLVQDVCVKISSAGSCRGTCARSVHANLLCKMFAPRSPQQDPAGPFLQNLCVRVSCARCCVKISSAGSSRATCARSLYADLLCKMSVSRSPQQDPVGPLAQDLCMSVSCAYLCVRISASASYMTTFARSLYADLLRKISLSGCLHQGPAGPLVQFLCANLVRGLSVRTFAPRSCRTTCARTLSADLFVWIFASGSRRPSCARSLHADLLRKMSASGSLY